MNPIRKISSHFAWTPQGWLRSPILSFDANGTLVGIEATDHLDAQPQVEFFNGILVPGFINAHCHTELSYLHGKIEPGKGFSAFADGIATHRNATDAAGQTDAFRYWDAKMYDEGVQAVGDICNGSLTFDAKTNSRIYYHNFIEYFGLATTDFFATDAVAGQTQKIGLNHSKTPHATYSLQDIPFRNIAEQNDRLSVHFYESRAEQELFEGTGALHERNLRMGVDIDFRHFGTPARRVVESVPSDKEILLIHNTFIKEEDVDLITDHFRAPPSWVLCPGSNRYIENAVPPVDLLRRKGVRIALGTDSLASNDSLSMVKEMAAFGHVPLGDRLNWATINGAEALGISEWAGSFEIGKRPGAVLISGLDWQMMQFTADSKSKRIL